MTTGQRIRRMREKRGMTQKELADKVGINVSVFNRIELNTRPARAEELAKIAEELSVTTDYLSCKTNVPTMTLDANQRKIIDRIDLSDEELLSIPMYVGNRKLTYEEKKRVIRTARALLDADQ